MSNKKGISRGGFLKRLLGIGGAAILANEAVGKTAAESGPKTIFEFKSLEDIKLDGTTLIGYVIKDGIYKCLGFQGEGLDSKFDDNWYGKVLKECLKNGAKAEDIQFYLYKKKVIKLGDPDPYDYMKDNIHGESFGDCLTWPGGNFNNYLTWTGGDTVSTTGASHWVTIDAGGNSNNRVKI